MKSNEIITKVIKGIHGGYSFNYLIKRGINETLQKYSHLNHSGKTFVGPVTAMISISDRCNYNCILCWIHSPHVDLTDPNIEVSNFLSKKKTIMGLELFKKAVDNLKSVGTTDISLCGRGDPLVNKDVVEMVGYVKSKGMHCGITTNGGLLTEEKAENLLGTGLDSLCVSIAAGSPETYKKIHPNSTGETYYKIREILKYISILKKENRHPTNIAVDHVISTFNCHEIPDMIHYAAECKVQNVSFMPVWTYDQITSFIPNKEQRKRLYQIKDEINELSKRCGIVTGYDFFLKKLSSFFEPSRRDSHENRERTKTYFSTHPCTIGYKFCLILADGRVLPCCLSNLVMGDISEKPFRDIWYSKGYNEFRRGGGVNLPKSGVPLPKCDCFNCDHALSSV